jgi:UDP-N-acetylmuramyl pentapeptide phosphotransferase/UDP-N-acetylglucosamine-1-phosphate transferase
MSPSPRHHIPALVWFVLLFSIALSVVFLARGNNYYPQLHVTTPDQIGAQFLMRAQDNIGACEKVLARIKQTVTVNCPTCNISTQACNSNLSTQEERILSDAPISQPSAHMPDGVITYSAPNSADALAACMGSQQNAPPGKTITCYAADSERKYFKPKTGWVDPLNIGYAFLILILAQLVAKFVCYLTIRYEHMHAHLSHDTSDGPQKFHAMPTPRIGGVAIIAGLLVSSAALTNLPQSFPDKDFGLLLLAAMPAFIGGLTEDITKKVGVAQRLLLTMLSAGFGAWLLGATLHRLDIPGVDTLMQWTPLAIAFTVFAVAGATNAINIIDGYNGLAAGFGIIVLAAMAFVSAQLGDTFLLTANLAMIGSLLGFLVWNWPGGKIFLGDGGAYLLGFWLAEMAVLIVARHPEVSVWFPMLLLIYPVFETLYSIYRRKIKRNLHPGHPDAMHLHQLIYCRLVRIHVGSKIPAHKTLRNSKVAIYFWVFNSFFAALACLLWKQTAALTLLCVLFCAIYAAIYSAIACWNAPKILKISSPSH